MGEEKKELNENEILLKLEANYEAAKSNYYRLVLRRQDDMVLKQLQKIPDNWEEYEKNRSDDSPAVPQEKQQRLSDLKKRKSWELKFESLNIYFIKAIEHAFLDTIQQKHMHDEQLEDAVDSVNNIILEIGANISNFKTLLLSLAKRGVSDLYYMIMSHDKFNDRQFNSFDEEFHDFCEYLIRHFQGYRNIIRNIDIFINSADFVEQFFTSSSSMQGWKINDNKVKQYLDNKEPEISIIELIKINTAADQYRKRLKKDFEYLNYYYNDRDGKLFRYNYIVDSHRQKLETGKVSQQVFEGLDNIRKGFLAIKTHTEKTGLGSYGSPGLSYSDLVNLILKTGKIIEVHYLRSSRYEDLKNFRNDILYYAQEEYHVLNPELERL